jgi:inosose dehydratase
MRAGGLGYLAAVRAKLFCQLGEGAVDFAAVTDALRALRYDGWIVVEQDVFPGCGTPEASARRSREYLRRLGL